jgi:hypothetical protein
MKYIILLDFEFLTDNTSDLYDSKQYVFVTFELIPRGL